MKAPSLDSTIATLPAALGGVDELPVWRQKTQVKLDAAGKARIKFENIRLPRQAKIKQVEYQEIVPISLISDYEVRRGQKVATSKLVNKENIHTVLQLLAKQSQAPGLNLRPNIANLDKLRSATPDDATLLTTFFLTTP